MMKKRKFIQRLDKSVLVFLAFSWLLFLGAIGLLIKIDFNAKIGALLLLTSIMLSICSGVLLRKKVTIHSTHIHFGVKKYRWEEINRISYEHFARIHEGGISVDQFMVFEMKHCQKRLLLKGLEDTVQMQLNEIQKYHPSVQLTEEMSKVLLSDPLYLNKLADQARQNAEIELEQFYSKKKTPSP